VISGLESPTTGSIKVRGEDIYKLSEDQRAQFRSEKFGIITQASHWVQSLNVWQNVAIPLVLKGNSFAGSKKRTMEVLKEVGMDEFANTPPNKLSGGQQQRVSIARALIRNPWIIVADEPTGNLDTHTSDTIMGLFQKLNTESKRTIIMVTHNLVYLPYATAKIAMRDGVIASQSTLDIAKQLEQEVATLKGGK
jgi:putative ABC transport system ATP-binding protein